MVEIATLEQALAWGEEWEAYARELQATVARINDELIDAKLDLRLAQLSLDIAKLPAPRRRSPFDEPIAA